MGELGLLEKSKRRADIEYALTILGLMANSGTLHDKLAVGEIAEHNPVLPNKGAIILFRDGEDGTVTIERPVSRDRIGQCGHLFTWGTMINVPAKLVKRVDVVAEVFQQ